MELPTKQVFVRNHKEPITINESDFDAKVHRAVEDGSWEKADKKESKEK